MYRNKYSTTFTTQRAPLTPDYTGDSDSDKSIGEELESKKRQIDKDVAHFQQQKKAEFENFRQELKERRKQRKALQYQINSNEYTFDQTSPSTTPEKESKRGSTGNTRRQGSRGAETPPIQLTGVKSASKQAVSTICVDKADMKARNMDRTQHSPPRTSSITAQFEKVNSSPRHSPQKSPLSPVRKEKTKQITNAPFLPLLETTDLNTFNTVKSPSLDLAPINMQSSSLPTQSSMSSTPLLTPTKRAYTSPITSRRILPSIIRNANKTIAPDRLKKRVTFRLSDRAIVEPRSSYEESPNLQAVDEPEIPEPAQVEEEPERPMLTRRNTPRRDVFGRLIKQSSEDTTPEEEIGMSMGDLMLAELAQEEEEVEVKSGKLPRNRSAPELDSYFSLDHQRPKLDHRRVLSVNESGNTSGSNSPEPSSSFQTLTEDTYHAKRRASLEAQRQQRKNSKDREALAKSISQPHKRISLEGKIDTARNTSIGFFELDEELSSPGLTSPEPYLAEIDPFSNNSSRQGSAAEDDGLMMRMGTSAPIDIRRPNYVSVSGSWVGTFGH